MKVNQKNKQRLEQIKIQIKRHKIGQYTILPYALLCKTLIICTDLYIKFLFCSRTHIIISQNPVFLAFGKLTGRDTYREYPNGDKLYDITAIFVIKKYHNDLKINDNESKKLEWFKIDNLPENMTEYTKNYIEKFGNILEEALKEFKN